MRHFLLILPLLISATWAGTDLEKQLQERREALQALERQLQERRQQLEDLEGEEKGVLNVISLLDGNLSRTRELIQELARNEETLDQSATRLHHEVDSLSADISSRRKAMAGRVVALYKEGETRTWRRILGVLREEPDLLAAVQMVRLLVRSDADRVHQLRTAHAERKSKADLLARRLGELRSVRSRKAKEEDRLAVDLQQQEKALGSLREDKESQRKALAEFERDQKTMMQIIKGLEDRRQKELEAARRKGVKPARKELAIDPERCRPVANGVITSGYGRHKHPVLGTITMNLGVEFKARKGEPVRAGASGTVVLVTRIDGRGPAVIVEHGGGFYSVYGHLQMIDVKEGQDLRRCQELGEVGDVESTDGPKLYFQVSQGVKTVDPTEWLGRSK